MDCKILWVDIGNTNVNFLCDDVYTSVAVQTLNPKLIPKHDKAVIACVANEYLIKYFSKYELINPKPYKNLNFNYDLTQLGVDRFLSVVAVFEKYPHQNIMIIDIGTFVTIDYINNNTHQSGGIVPGFEQLERLNNFTGNDSKKAWSKGVSNMLNNYINTQIESFQGKILLTGGGQKKIQKSGVEYHQNLVLSGLKVSYGK